MKIVSDINAFVYIVLTIFYCYQGIYVIIALLGKKKKKNYNTEAKTLHKYAFIIAARNENAVIGNLIDSIKNQNYPSELIDVIVLITVLIILRRFQDNTVPLFMSVSTIYLLVKAMLWTMSLIRYVKNAVITLVMTVISYSMQIILSMSITSERWTKYSTVGTKLSQAIVTLRIMTLTGLQPVILYGL